VSWGTGYGLTTSREKAPVSPADQVSPAYLYSTVRNALALGCHSSSDILQDSCKGKKATI
jgi:hypothetical protein